MRANEMFGGAKWMSPGRIQVPCIRGEFTADGEIVSAELVICGLGMYELSINGEVVGDDLYGTLSTDFHPWEGELCEKSFGERLSHRIYAVKYDVAKLLGEKNCIAVMLAPGWYRCGIGDWVINDYGDDKLCFRLTLVYSDGRREEIVSDEGLRFTQSNIVKWNMFHGEEQDYHSIELSGWKLPGYDDSEWSRLTEVDAPDTEFLFTDCPPDRVIRRIEPKLISETADEYIYDMGENITGTPIIRSTSEAGSSLTLRVSERLDSAGGIEDYTNHGQRAVFITDGSDREYSLRFCWFGFRYAAVSKNARIVSCAVIHSDIPVSSGFKSDSKLLDWLYETYIRTQLDNMHCGIPSDCPHLEKRGYTGDGELVCECGMLMLDSKKFYLKWLGDIADCQDKVSGHVQYTAPYTCCGGGPGGWGCAIIEVPYNYYKTYGDCSVLGEFLPRGLRYFDYLDAHSEKGLVVSDQKGQWCLGDWCTPEDISIPEPFVNTYFYVKSIDRLLEFCAVLGRDELVPELKARRERLCAAITREYFDPDTGDFAGNIQGANAFAVDIGLGDDRALANLAAHYERETMYDTGIFGTDIVTRVLFERGFDELAFGLLTSDGKYSFRSWMDSGCTTFPEYWTYKRSQNHPMFGAVTKYLFIYLLGIGQAGAGYGELVIAPHLVEGLDYAEGFITTVHGRVAVGYRKSGEELALRVEIPEGVKASLSILGGQYELKAGVNEKLLRFDVRSEPKM